MAGDFSGGLIFSSRYCMLPIYDGVQFHFDVIEGCSKVKVL